MGVNKIKHNLRFAIILLLIASVLLCGASCVPSARAQSTSGTIVENLTFHYYSLLQKAENGSYFAYDGADAVGPRLTTAYQTTLNAQIKGSASGFTYWMATIAWIVELPKDVHVLGNVEIKAYMSSTFEGFTGFLSGGGYGMGLVDIDENGNYVEEFMAQASPTIGGNPFTPTPTAYSLSVEVDYVFKKDHFLGFFIGAGATVQGFTFTVYFDSQDRNSGATLPIADQTETFRFNAVWEGNTYEIVAISNSSLSNFGFNQPQKQISYNASGIRGTTGYSKVWIPKTLLAGPFKVFIDSQQITPTETENATHSCIYFTYTHGTGIIKIVAESTTPPQPDQLDHVMIIPSSKILQIGTTQQFSAQGYDQNNNPISGLNFSWTVTGGIGSVNPTSGQTTTFTGSTAGSGSLNATTTYRDVTKSGSASITVTTTPPPADTTPPTITHTPISAANDGQTITISATITDDVAVTEAKLYYRKGGETTYTSVTITPSGNTYAGTIPASMVTTAGVQYYINATDGTNFSTHPATNPTTSPHTIIVILMNIPPTAATLNNPSDSTQNSLKLTWTQNTEADFARYEIYQSTTSGTLGTKIYTIADRSITSYTVTELSANTTYYFTIRVVDTASLFADSVQVNGKTTPSATPAEAESTPPWTLLLVGGLVAIFAAVTITILALRQRKK